MIKSLELTHKTSCLNRAHDDEPLFVLRANDPLAPHIVRRWATEYQVRKSQEQASGLTLEQNMKVDEARELAGDMERWRRKNRA